MDLQKQNENVTGQGILGAPEPVGTGSGRAGSTRPSASDRSKQTVGNQAKTVTGTTEEGQDPFKRRDSLARTPPPRERTRSLPEVPSGMKSHPKKIETEAERLEREEHFAFEALGRNIEIIDKIVKDARNIHKQIRDATVAATIYYQRLKEARERRAKLNPKSCDHSLNLAKDAAVQTEERDGGQKRAATSPIQTPRHGKRTRPKTAATTNVGSTVEVVDPPEEDEHDPDWQMVDHRKKKKKKEDELIEGARNKKEDNDTRKSQKRRRLPEAVAVKINGQMSYASVLKEIKSKVDPDKMGLQVSGIRRTRAGEILIEVKNSEKMEELKTSVAAALGDGATVRTLDSTVSLVVKDLDGATEAPEVVAAIKAVTGEVDDNISVRALRKVFGETQMAVVTMSKKAAARVLKEGRIRIGWLMCRVQERREVTKCFRCLCFGHYSRDCKGLDRTKTCRLCGKEGHFAKDCTEKPFCVACSDNKELGGADHILGSKKCESYRRETQRTRT